MFIYLTIVIIMTIIAMWFQKSQKNKGLQLLLAEEKGIKMKKKFLSVGLLFCMVLTVFAGGCTSNADESTDNNTSQDSAVSADDTGMADNITYNGEVTEGGILVVFVKNENEVAVDMELKAQAFDEDGNELDYSTREIYSVEKGAEIAFDMQFANIDSFDTYEISVIEVQEAENSSYFDDIEIESEKEKIKNEDNKEVVIAEVTNNSEDDIGYIEIGCVFYQGDELVAYMDAIADDTKSGETVGLEIEPIDEEGNNIEFDSYEAFLNQAYNYDK